MIAAPVLTPVVVLRAAQTGIDGRLDAWLGLAYVSVVSMFLGFFVWYRGLARGGIARIGRAADRSSVVGDLDELDLDGDVER